jgi:lipoprotein-releasing system ATP-binding protein
MLSAKNLSKKYNNLTVLNNVSLEIDKGEFACIVGPSGAGKSTLLHLLSALDTPDNGEVIIDNINIVKLTNKAQASFRNINFGFVFQFHHLLPEFTALENVCIPLYIGKVEKAASQEKGKRLLEKVGLSERMNHKPSELSGGEQQRVAIARALVQEPKFLFADEPTGNLDSSNADNIHNLFKSIQNEFNISIIIVTHNEKLAKMADKIYEMKDGEIINIMNNRVN